MFIKKRRRRRRRRKRRTLYGNGEESQLAFCFWNEKQVALLFPFLSVCLSVCLCVRRKASMNELQLQLQLSLWFYGRQAGRQKAFSFQIHSIGYVKVLNESLNVQLRIVLMGPSLRCPLSLLMGPSLCCGLLSFCF